MRNVSGKCFRENQSTHFVFNNFFHENHAVYEVLWTNVFEPERPHMTTTRRMRFACWITKATNTHTHTQNMYNIILTAYPRQQRFLKRASIFPYMYIVCLFNFELVLSVEVDLHKKRT